MARLTRKNIKVFAENATNNGVFGSLQAGNPVTTSNVEQVQSLPAWSTGWDSATMTSEKLPPLEEFQGVQYVTTYQQAYLMQEGIPEWASTVTYYKGCLAKEVTANGFRIYNSLTNNNKNHSLSDTSNWKKVMDSDDLYAFDGNVVHLTGNETISGRKTFSADPYIMNGSPSVIGFEQDLQKGSNPSAVATGGFSYFDDSGVTSSSSCFGQVGCRIYTNGTTESCLRAFRNVANSTEFADITVSQPVTGSPYTYAPTPTDTTSTSSHQIATVGWVNSSGNNLMHLSGNETIAGTKTFVNTPILSQSTPYVVFSSTDITKGTNPSENKNYVITCSYDNSAGVDKAIGRFEVVLRSNGLVSAQIAAYKNEAGSTEGAAIAVYYPQTGSPYTAAPTPTATTSTSSSQIATVGWVNTVGNNVVHLSGNETISGTKTFNDPPALLVNTLDYKGYRIQNSQLKKGTAPSNSAGGQFVFQDSTDIGASGRIGGVESRYTSEGIIETRLQAFKPELNSQTNASITIYYPPTGNPYTYAPASDVVNSIVTTVAKSKSANGYYKLGNGLIIQWGRKSYVSPDPQSVTFPTPFTSTNYKVVGSYYYNGNITSGQDQISIASQTTTGFTFYMTDTADRSVNWIAIGY